MGTESFKEVTSLLVCLSLFSLFAVASLGVSRLLRRIDRKHGLGQLQNLGK